MLININGQSYATWEEVPPEVRQQLAARLPDADHNGIPDLLEGNLAGLGDLAAGGQPATFTSISVDGQQVDSLGQLPPEVQELLKNALGLAQPGSAATPGPTPGGAPPTGVPLQPGEVMLNGVPTAVGAEPAKKPWWKRLFGG
jgi:hypothetical protein